MTRRTNHPAGVPERFKDRIVDSLINIMFIGVLAAIVPLTACSQETKKPAQKKKTDEITVMPPMDTTRAMPEDIVKAPVEDTSKSKPVSEEKMAAMDTVDVTSLYISGVDQRRSGDPHAAVATFEEVLQRVPDHVPAMVNLARAYLDLELYEKAEWVLEGAMEADGSNASVYHVRGRLNQSMGYNEEAISSYQRSIELDSFNPYAYNNLALIYIEDSLFHEAVPLLEKAIDQKGDVVFFHNNLGIAYEGIGNLIEAEGAFLQALNNDPGYEKSINNLQRVQDRLAEQRVASSVRQDEPDKESSQENDPVARSNEKP